ncbi:hypothetical protein Srot_2882 [Segniliparus rotundus DSM 44985]|uniref:Lipoprotein n=1 Tax=Segniliparus rotundus (strain ATCC BAA-972 / CDC 1076 / CIP 108378 / DSM 44985 / JCM 13578) TaxID=640132 RepID=D6ZDQ6_SEGRD|nr:hypothetical protein [Segniliparus rotundus]ADG99313.1 hypothetical protein Srot_2882 [Segniliparus rotundus DSM 44985]
MRRPLLVLSALAFVLVGCGQGREAHPATPTRLTPVATSSASPKAAGQASPKATASTSASATVATFVGHWRGHGRSLVVGADGTGKVVARTYQKCGDPGVSGPCDTLDGDEIKPGAVTQIKITAVREAVDVVIADFTVQETTLDVPRGSTGTLTLNPVRDALQIAINGTQGDGYYCGPKADPGYCGA